MFKRLFWLLLGMGMGAGLTFRVSRFVRETRTKYSPHRLTNDVTTSARRVGSEIREAVAEGRQAMRQREAELRAELAPNPASVLNAPR